MATAIRFISRQRPPKARRRVVMLRCHVLFRWCSQCRLDFFSHHGGGGEEKAEGADQNPQAAGESSRRHDCSHASSACSCAEPLASAAAAPRCLFAGFIDAAVQRAALLFSRLFNLLSLVALPELLKALVQSGFYLRLFSFLFFIASQMCAQY